MRSGPDDPTVDVRCPVCDGSTRRWFRHPDAEIYRCPSCTHVFTRLDSLALHERYDEDYRATHANWFEHPNRGLFSWIGDHIPADASSIVDVGCGNGALLTSLRQDRRTARLVGVDLYPETDVEGIEIMQGDIMSLPIEGTFDAVTSLAAIEHVPDVLAFTRRLVEICRAGGTVVVMTLNGDSILYSAARLARRLGMPIASNRLYSTHHLQHFTRRSLRTLMHNAGLEVRSVHHHNAPLKALDLPPTNRFVDPVLRAGVAVTFGLGRLTRRCYLQTIVCTRPA